MHIQANYIYHSHIKVSCEWYICSVIGAMMLKWHTFVIIKCLRVSATYLPFVAQLD